jgi:hypothetical protein
MTMLRTLASRSRLVDAGLLLLLILTSSWLMRG